MCESQQNSGYSIDGSDAEYMLVDSKFAGRTPDGVDPDEIEPILCAGVTVYKGLKQTGVKPGQWAVISGVGGLGHVAVQYAIAMGMTRRDGTSVLVGLPPGTFEVNIFDVAPRGVTVRGCIVGKRQDLQEAIDLYAAGKIVPTVSVEDVDDAADVLDRLDKGDVEGRVVLSFD